MSGTEFGEPTAPRPEPPPLPPTPVPREDALAALKKAMYETDGTPEALLEALPAYGIEILAAADNPAPDARDALTTTDAEVIATVLDHIEDAAEYVPHLRGLVNRAALVVPGDALRTAAQAVVDSVTGVQYGTSTPREPVTAESPWHWQVSGAAIEALRAALDAAPATTETTDPRTLGDGLDWSGHADPE